MINIQPARPARPKVARLRPISISEVYPLDVFKRRTGLDAWALKRARKNGLRVVKVGRRSYVRGADWDAYLATLPDTPADVPDAVSADY